MFNEIKKPILLFSDPLGTRMHSACCMKLKGRGLILEALGELPLEVQAMLLTFIETDVYRRVGGERREHL